MGELELWDTYIVVLEQTGDLPGLSIIGNPSPIEYTGAEAKIRRSQHLIVEKTGRSGKVGESYSTFLIVKVSVDR